MGRRRLHIDPREPLPTGLFKEGRKFRARRPGESWTYFGERYGDAVAAYTAWQAKHGVVRTIAWLMDHFVGEVCPAKVRAGKMAPRTARDYLRDSEIIKTGLGHIPITAFSGAHATGFVQAREQDAPAHVRNELACLSAALTNAVDNGVLPRNVLIGFRRPTKQVRERLITDAEYLKVRNAAGPSTRLAMALAVRTLGLPADVLRMGRRNVVKYADGRRTLRFRRGKTGIQVEVEIVGELAVALEPLLDSIHPTFVRREDGKAYTVDGIGAMFRRYCDAKHADVSDFGLRDLRAKGATDMYRAGIDLRVIQRLLGHKSVQTTEIYIKQLLTEIVQPNMQPIIAEVR